MPFETLAFLVYLLYSMYIDVFEGGTHMKSTLYVEYQEKQLAEKDLVTKAKKLWTDSGKKASELTSLQLYVKPEENMVYCVFNEDITDSFSLD